MFLPLYHLIFLLSSKLFSPLSILNIPFFQINYSSLKFALFWQKTCPLSLHMKQVVESGILRQVGRLYPIFFPWVFLSVSLRHLFGKKKNRWDAQGPGIILYLFWNKRKEIQTPILFSVNSSILKYFFFVFLKPCSDGEVDL